MAFILAFVFRAFVVEAFVIPTGSMAPTLLGQHADVTCPQCGYQFNADVGKAANSPVGAAYSTTLTCSMCSYPIKTNAARQTRPGDRILVHKFIYNFSEPKRWDVVVFKNPSNPQDNFIKRLVGLPNEKLCIIDGNVYTQPLDKPDTPWQIQRKADREVVQRTVWQPVYHSEFYPLDEGKSSLSRGSAYSWRFPWIAQDPDQFERTQRTWLNYDGKKPATLNFDYMGMLNSQINYYGNAVGWYPYSQLNGMRQIEPIEDIRMAINVVPKPQADKQAEHLGLIFQTTGRVEGVHAVPIRATLAQNGKITIATGPSGLRAIDTSTQWKVRASEQFQPLPNDKASKIEFWFVDQQVSLWINQQKILSWEFEVPMQTLLQRIRPQTYPNTSVQIQGTPATITQLDLDRDLFYSTRPNMTKEALGGIYKSGTELHGKPVAIEPDQFYCLGDNSPFSHDGRYWSTVNPWIEKRLFVNKKQVIGLVPRELMIGKAFFVYFPAPHRLTPTSPGVVPNFGDVRFIH